MTAAVLPRSTVLAEAGRDWSAQLGLDEARALTAQIRASVEVLLPLIRTAYQRRADLALGYASWEAYCDGELHALRLAVADRQEAVAGLRAEGMSTRAIGAALGVSHQTVQRDLATGPSGPVERITGLDGREQPASRPTSSPGSVDAAVTPPADPGAAPAPVELAPHRYVSGPGRRCSAPGCGRAPNAALHRSANWLPRESPAPAVRSHTTTSAVTQEPGPTPEPGGVDLSAAQPPGSGPAPAPATDAPAPSQEPAPAAPQHKPTEGPSAEQREALPDAVLSALAGADPEVGLTRTEIWARLPMQSVRSAWVGPVLHELADAGRVLVAGHGPHGARWVATPDPAPPTAPAGPGLTRERVLAALPRRKAEAVSLGEVAVRLGMDPEAPMRPLRELLEELEAAGETARTQGAATLVWWATGPGSDYIADPAGRIAAVAEAAPEFVRPADPDWGTRFSTSIDTAAALVSTLDERYPSADIAAWATAEHQAEVHALLALVEAFAARVDAAVAA